MSAALLEPVGHEVVIFRGVPPSLTGDVLVENPSDRDLRLNSATARLEHGGQEFKIRFAGRLPANSKSRVRAHCRVDRYLAPGSYRAVLHHERQQIPVEFRVDEQHSLIARPSPVRIRGAEGAEVVSELLIENLGNLRVEIPRVASVFFEEADWLGRCLVVAMRQTEAGDKALDYADKVFQSLKSSMVHTTRLHIEADRHAIEPGEVLETRLKMTIPVGLQGGRTYRAFFDINGTRFWIELAPVGGNHGLHEEER